MGETHDPRSQVVTLHLLEQDRLRVNRKSTPYHSFTYMGTTLDCIRQFKHHHNAYTFFVHAPTPTPFMEVLFGDMPQWYESRPFVRLIVNSLLLPIDQSDHILAINTYLRRGLIKPENLSKKIPLFHGQQTKGKENVLVTHQKGVVGSFVYYAIRVGRTAITTPDTWQGFYEDFPDALKGMETTHPTFDKISVHDLHIDEFEQQQQEHFHTSRTAYKHVDDDTFQKLVKLSGDVSLSNL